MNKTNKIKQFLALSPELPTSEIVSNIKEQGGINVSYRLVQYVRKDFQKANLEKRVFTKTRTYYNDIDTFLTSVRVRNPGSKEEFRFSGGLDIIVNSQQGSDFNRELSENLSKVFKNLCFLDVSDVEYSDHSISLTITGFDPSTIEADLDFFFKKFVSPLADNLRYKTEFFA
jgi:hypothetical protein